jgi:hypothetical protein
MLIYSYAPTKEMANCPIVIRVGDEWTHKLNRHIPDGYRLEVHIKQVRRKQKEK